MVCLSLQWYDRVDSSEYPAHTHTQTDKCESNKNATNNKQAVVCKYRRCARKDGFAAQQFAEDATKTPHIDRFSVFGGAKQNLWCAIPARGNIVGEHLSVAERWVRLQHHSYRHQVSSSLTLLSSSLSCVKLRARPKSALKSTKNTKKKKTLKFFRKN